MNKNRSNLRPLKNLEAFIPHNYDEFDKISLKISEEIVDFVIPIIYGYEWRLQGAIMTYVIIKWLNCFKGVDDNETKSIQKDILETLTKMTSLSLNLKQ